MEYGFNVPNGGPLAVPERIATLARHGEKLGYRILAIPDHIVVPKGIDSPYPYSPDGTLTFPTLLAGECLEPLALMAYLAGVTTEMRLLTSVMVVPYRHPVLTAKLLSTIDLLSGGRAVVGVGAGWMAEEFPPVGAPPFEARGRATDEYLRIYKELWTADAPRYDGEFASFDNILFHPKPVQKPHPPIWVGGESKPAKRRTVRHGDAWFPIGCNPRFPMDTLGRFAAGLDDLRAIAEAEGRDPASIDLAFWAVWYGASAEPIVADTGERMLLTGSADDIASDIQAMRDLGVRHLVLQVLRETLEETLDVITGFAEEVRPKADA
ncbi:MAG: LLM class F420-dependent oxidoreductase [Rhodospirillaceae bacterium]|nr:LLM class F420-dependent oxidoreductase [Rhodospirillaceae bacterium]